MRNTPLNLRYKSIQKRFMFGLTCIVFLYIIVDQSRVYIISFCQIYISMDICFFGTSFPPHLGGRGLGVRVPFNDIKVSSSSTYNTIYHPNTQVATRGKLK